MRIRTIKVVPNPYLALDADGRAQGVVAKEGSPDTYVGATLNVEESRKTGKNIFVVSSDPVEVPATPYYMRRLQERDLLPADAETAKYAGLKDFTDADSTLLKERELALNTYGNANQRDPAFVEDERRAARVGVEGDQPGGEDEEILRTREQVDQDQQRQRALDPTALRSPPIPSSAWRGSSPPARESQPPKRTT